MSHVYWASSIFGAADREFNENCVRRLRENGHKVVSPQENAFNAPVADPSAREIFLGDTTGIQESEVLVACIDQEPIDSGVACEIGIAWALGKRIYGLYTDFRQHRVGQFRMYKNPYVVGCIEDHGIIVSTIEDLMKELRRDS